MAVVAVCESILQSRVYLEKTKVEGRVLLVVKLVGFVVFVWHHAG